MARSGAQRQCRQRRLRCPQRRPGPDVRRRASTPTPTASRTPPPILVCPLATGGLRLRNPPGKALGAQRGQQHRTKLLPPAHKCTFVCRGRGLVLARARSPALPDPMTAPFTPSLSQPVKPGETGSIHSPAVCTEESGHAGSYAAPSPHALQGEGFDEDTKLRWRKGRATAAPSRSAFVWFSAS